MICRAVCRDLSVTLRAPSRSLQTVLPPGLAPGYSFKENNDSYPDTGGTSISKTRCNRRAFMPLGTVHGCPALLGQWFLSIIARLERPACAPSGGRYQHSWSNHCTDDGLC